MVSGLEGGEREVNGLGGEINDELMFCLKISNSVTKKVKTESVLSFILIQVH